MATYLEGVYIGKNMIEKMIEIEIIDQNHVKFQITSGNMKDGDFIGLKKEI